MKISKWLHLAENQGTAWCVRIWTVIQGSGNTVPATAGRLGYVITLKLRMIEKQISRLNEECHQLFEKAKQHEPWHVYTAGIRGQVFSIDSDLQYRVMLDIDSLIFEMNSCCELVGKFLSEIYKHLGKECDPNDIGKELLRILKAKKQDTKWFRLLDRERNFFIHDGAPYHAIDISGDRYDLLIMKEHLKDYKDNDRFIALSELNYVSINFHSSMDVIRDYIMSLYEE